MLKFASNKYKIKKNNYRMLLYQTTKSKEKNLENNQKKNKSITFKDQ